MNASLARTPTRAPTLRLPLTLTVPLTQTVALTVAAILSRTPALTPTQALSRESTPIPSLKLDLASLKRVACVSSAAGVELD